MPRQTIDPGLKDHPDRVLALAAMFNALVPVAQGLGITHMPPSGAAPNRFPLRLRTSHFETINQGLRRCAVLEAEIAEAQAVRRPLAAD